ncbi:hypothetical protein [Candidatus Poriferisocius sp.]|uniref:hypothetical protein n=1 Tax=Candidatus Poriferisocius sp. TaxID=3101276 RepID=UPI003B51C63A
MTERPCRICGDPLPGKLNKHDHWADTRDTCPRSVSPACFNAKQLPGTRKRRAARKAQIDPDDGATVIALADMPRAPADCTCHVHGDYEHTCRACGGTNCRRCASRANARYVA